MTDYNDNAIIDYLDFTITVNKLIGSREFANKVQLIQQKYARKDAMIDKGQLSKTQSKKVNDDKSKDIANLYADMVIASWNGLWKGADDKVIYDFNKDKPTKENIVAFCLDKNHQDLVADIIEQATIEANFIKEQEAAEEKNLPKS
jgi:hypothetical protein